MAKCVGLGLGRNSGKGKPYATGIEHAYRNGNNEPVRLRKRCDAQTSTLRERHLILAYWRSAPRRPLSAGLSGGACHGRCGGVLAK